MADLRPLVTVWGTWLVLMGGANVAAPLYAVYATRYGFSSLVLTATIAVSLVAVTLAATALLGAGWQVRARPARGRAHPAST